MMRARQTSEQARFYRRAISTVSPRRLALASILAIAALAGSGALAQSGIQATLTGIVVDKDGGPIPGVTVTARSTTSAMAAVVTVTDGTGHYRLTPLPPANDYLVVAELPGFARIEIGPVDLDPGKTTTQNITLVPSSDMSQKITVVGKGDIVDVASTKTATVFNSEFIEGLPILGRTYQDILTLAPGVTDTDGDGNPNVNGARDTDFQTRVDGANTTDPVTGTFGQNLNLEAIAEIEIITTGASAEFSQAQGGFANIITKSGSNDLEGSAKFFFRSDLFDNDGGNNNDVTDSNLLAGLDGFNDIRPFFTLGGPFVRDRLWYFMTLEYISLETPVNTLTFPVLRTQEGWNNFFKLTWQLNPSHRMAFQVNQDPARFTGGNLRTGVAPESSFIFDQGGVTPTVRWTYNINPSVLLETLVSYFDSGIDLLPATDPGPCVVDEAGRCNPFAEDNYTIDVRQGTVNGPFNVTSRDSRTRATLKSDLSLFLETGHGSHNVKTGFEAAKESFANRLTTRRIRFDDVQASANRGLGGSSLAGSINFQDAVPASFPGTVAIDSNLDGEIGPQDQVFDVPELTAEKDNFGFYVQDSFKPMPNLTINLGLRYDREAATTDGYESFEPAEQAEQFLRRYEVARGLPSGSATFQDAFGAPQPIYDLNGDGLDNLHCSPYDIDGAAFGDGLGSGGGGAIDDFWTYYDGDYDGVLTPGDPDDIILQVPDGVYDGAYVNPLCDKASDDTYALISAFSRHQFDPTGEPFASLGKLDPERGLAGTQRTQETFTLVNNNVAPRFSVSWDPWADNRTKIFATWSRFYDKLFLATLIPELGPDPRTVVYSPNDQSATAVPLQTGRFTITQVDRGMKTPFTDELTLGFEREIAPEWSILVSYVKRTGRDQLQDVDLNHYVQDVNGDGVFDDNFGRVDEVTGDAGGGGGGDSGGGGLALAGFAVTPDGQPDLFALNPFFNQVLRVGNYNSSAYHSLQVVVTRRLSRNWQMNGSYVYSEAVGDAESFLSGNGDDPGTVDDEFGPLTYDQTHRLIFSAVTFLPGAQSLGGTVEWTSGLPFSLVRRRESADSFGSFFFRTTYPTEQRNDQRNEGQWLLNLAYKKNFVFGKANASVGVDVENLLNTDDLRINNVDQELFLGVDAERRFGRRWQLSASIYF
jgi:outer membrane receptor protein involved in Fe transport